MVELAFRPGALVKPEAAIGGGRKAKLY